MVSFLLLGAVEKIKIDQLLVRKAGLVGQAFEIVQNLRTQVDSRGSGRREERFLTFVRNDGQGEEEERFLTSAGRRIRRSECGRKSRPAPFEMTGGRGRRGLNGIGMCDREPR